MTARRRLTFKVVWAAFDEHRIMKHSGPSVKEVSKLKNPSESLKQRHTFENAWPFIWPLLPGHSLLWHPTQGIQFHIHNKWQNKTRHCIVWLFDLVLQTLREPVAAKEFEAEVSVGSESFCTPGFLMLFRVSLAGGKIMETICIEWNPLSDILLVDFKNLIKRRKKWLDWFQGPPKSA